MNFFALIEINKNYGINLLAENKDTKILKQKSNKTARLFLGGRFFL